MRRAVIAACLVATTLAPASVAAARPHARYVVTSHGDRIPRGADRRLHRHGVFAHAAANDVTSQLADNWCGSENAADDVVDQAAAGNAIKVVYAHPVDVPDHFTQYAPVIQAAAKAVQNAFLDATGGARTVRFDVGTSCGPTYLDIESVALPQTAASYSADNASTMSSDLRPLVAGSPSCPTVSMSSCTRDFLVFADGVYKNDGTTGVATRRTDDSPLATNASNSGGQFAYVLGDQSPDFSISPQTTAEHEILHNLGAVQGSAIHYSGNGHCFDAVDVMCYDDSGSYFTGGGQLVFDCPGAPDSTIDCGHDDYFNPAGTVLGTSGNPIWNIAGSKFLCACGGLNQPPVAAFSATQGARAGTPVAFDASASTDDSGIASYQWDFGDGATGAGPATAHVYGASGTFTARLTVTDDDGASAAATVPVTVAAVPVVTPPALVVPPPSSLSAARSAASARLRRIGGLRGLLRGRSLRVTYTPVADGRLTGRLILVTRTVARSSASGRALRPVTTTLRLSKASRRRLRRAHGSVRVALAFVKR